MWLDKHYKKFTSASFQNEIIKLVGLGTVRDVLKEIKQSSCKYYRVMEDETSGVSGREHC